MQSNHNDIYKLTSLRTGEDEQKYKDIGNYVFMSLYKHMRKPPSLILKLKGIGSWYLRKKRMEIVLEHFPPNFDKTQENFTHPSNFLKHENRVEIYNLFKERIEDYKKYIEIRDELRQIRYKDQKPINNDTETGQDNNS